MTDAVSADRVGPFGGSSYWWGSRQPNKEAKPLTKEFGL